MTMVVVTSSLSLARELWRYGEPELADAAADLSAEDVLAVGKRAGSLAMSGDAARLWPNGPSGAAVMLAAVERLEGWARPCRLARRLPEKRLPERFQAGLEARLAAASEVAAVMDRENAAKTP
jgi:hypothetical protein